VRGIAFAGAGGTRHTGWPEPIEDLDSIPIPVQGFVAHGVDPRTQLMYMITSRGCPARCTFCNTPEFWGTKIRFRSVDHVLAEMRALRASFGLMYLSIRDDTFTAHRRRVLELCERMRDERLYFLWDCQSRVNAVDEERLIAMRRAGCVHIQYGVESGSPRVLTRLAKDIGPDQIEAAARWTRRVGLVFSVYLIAGTPGEDDADVAATEALLARIRPHDVMVSPLAVFPGTALWSGMKAAGRLGEGVWAAGSREDVYVRSGDPAAEDHLRRLGAAAERAAARNAFTVRDYAAHRRRVGDCHALDLSEADLHAGEGRSGDAARILSELARREPDNPWAQLRLGQIHLAGRRFARAADHLEELTRIVPRFAEGHALLGRALGRLRRESAAATALTAALRLDPLHAAARRTLRRLGAVEASAPVGPRPSTPSALLRA
jgi:hypothetical protein